MITFPAVPRSSGLILTFSMSPDLRLEPGGGVSVPAGSSRIPATLFDHHSLE
jgi:hypothetical protein